MGDFGIGKTDARSQGSYLGWPEAAFSLFMSKPVMFGFGPPEAARSILRVYVISHLSLALNPRMGWAIDIPGRQHGCGCGWKRKVLDEKSGALAIEGSSVNSIKEEPIGCVQSARPLSRKKPAYWPTPTLRSVLVLELQNLFM